MNKTVIATLIAILLGMAAGAIVPAAFAVPPQNGRAKTGIAIITGENWIEPFGNAKVPDMVRTADLIVIGQVKQVLSPHYMEIMHGRNSPTNKVCQLPLSTLKEASGWQISVDRVLKGKLPDREKTLKVRDLGWEASLKVDKEHGVQLLHRPAPPMSGCPQLSYGMVFLKADPSGGYRFVDQDHIMIPAAPGKSSNAPSPDSLSAVVSELLRVLSTPAVTLSKCREFAGIGSFQTQSRAFLVNEGESVQLNAVTVLKDLPPEITARPLKSLVKSAGDQLSRLLAVDCLVQLGDWSSLEAAKESLLIPTPALDKVKNQLLQSIDNDVYSARNSTTKTLTGVQVFSELLRSKDVEVRKKAASWLATLAGDQAIAQLINLGLKDTNVDVRDISIRGLASLTGTGASYWQDNPAFAIEFNKKVERLPPFSTALGPGAIFEQKRFDDLLNKRLAPKRSQWFKVPNWVQQSYEARVPSMGGWWWEYDGLNSNNWSGGEAAHGRGAYYWYHRTYDPEASSDKFTQKTSDVFFMLEAGKQHKAGDATDTSSWFLKPAKIINVWQRDNEEIYQKISDQKVRITHIMRIYDRNGTALAKPPDIPGLVCGQRSVDRNDSDLVTPNVDPRVIERETGNKALVAQLESFLKQCNKSDELSKLHLALANLQLRIKNLPPDSPDSVPPWQAGGPGSHPNPQKSAKRIEGLDLPRKGGMFGMYSNGLGQVLDCCIELARSGNPNAEFGVGWLYLHGGVNTIENPKLAEHWYRKAAGHGSAAAADEIGWMYESGSVLSKSYAEALKWYQLASDKGDQEAIYDLGQMYEKGLGTKVDIPKAMLLYEKCFKGKFDPGAIAMESLWARNLAKPSADVARGETNPVDFTIKYGSFWPQVTLAKLYDEGPGVKRDIDKAIALYAKAVSGLGSDWPKDDWSKQKLEKLKKEAQSRHH